MGVGGLSSRSAMSAPDPKPYFELEPRYDRAPEGALRALFVGTSHTYYHSMPQLAERYCARPLVARVLAHPLRSLADHLASDELAPALERGPLDVLVLQEKTTLPLERFEEYLSSVERASERARRAWPGVRVVLQRHWPRAPWHRDYVESSALVGADPAEMFARLCAVTARVREALDVELAPVGDAWMRAKLPPQRLYNRGGNHANLAGAMLTAHVHATIIAGEPSQALGFRHEACWEIAEPLAEWAHEAVFARGRTVGIRAASPSKATR